MKTRTNATRTAFLISGLFAASIGIGAGVGGGALVWAHSTQRDSAGFYSTSAERLTTSSFAMTSPGPRLRDRRQRGPRGCPAGAG